MNHAPSTLAQMGLKKAGIVFFNGFHLRRKCSCALIDYYFCDHFGFSNTAVVFHIFL